MGMTDSITRRTRKAKYEAAVGKLAIDEAKMKNDPAYKKYKKCRDKFLDLKNEIIKRYYARARSKVKR